MVEKTVEKTLALKVIVALHAIGGVLLLLIGLAAVVMGSTIAAALVGSGKGAVAGGAGGLIGAVAGILGVILLVIGIVYLLIAWGLWNLKSWARWLTTIFAALSVLSILMGNFLSAAFGVIVIYVLWGDEKTKALFAQ